MDVRVGHKYKWNKQGAYLFVTTVREDKIKFEVYGAKCGSISGSMSPCYFAETYTIKDRIREKQGVAA